MYIKVDLLILDIIIKILITSANVAAVLFENTGVQKNDLRIIDLKTNKVFYNEYDAFEDEEVNSYYFNDGDELNLSCEQSSSSNDSLHWEIGGRKCGSGTTGSQIRYQTVLRSVDSETKLLCISRSLRGVTHRVAISFINAENRTFDECLDLTQLVCPSHTTIPEDDRIVIFANERRLKLRNNDFLSTDEYTYFYKKPEKLDLRFAVTNDHAIQWDYLYLCGELVGHNQRICKTNYCKLSLSIKLKEFHNDSVLYCTASMINGPTTVAALRLIATSGNTRHNITGETTENNDRTHNNGEKNKTTLFDEGETDSNYDTEGKTTANNGRTQNNGEKNKPICFEVEKRGSNYETRVVYGLLIIAGVLIVIFIIMLITELVKKYSGNYTVRGKANTSNAVAEMYWFNRVYEH